MIDYKNINVITEYDEGILITDELLDSLGILYNQLEKNRFICEFNMSIKRELKDNNNNDWIEKGTHEDPNAEYEYEYNIYSALDFYVCSIENLKQLKSLYYVLNS